MFLLVAKGNEKLVIFSQLLSPVSVVWFDPQGNRSLHFTTTTKKIKKGLWTVFPFDYTLSKPVSNEQAQSINPTAG